MFRCTEANVLASPWILTWTSPYFPTRSYSMGRQFIRGLGWVPDIPDPRDYDLSRGTVYKKLTQLKKPRKERDVDLREFFPSAVDDQGLRHISSIHACLGLIEYFHARSMGHVFDASSEFLHCMARRYAELKGSSGVGIRNTLKAIRRFGLPPHQLWSLGETEQSESRLLDPSLFCMGPRLPSAGLFPFGPEDRTQEATKKSRECQGFR